MESLYGEGAAEAYDEYLEFSLGDFARGAASLVAKAAPVIATVGGGALQGAMAGSAAGLPGIIAGAAVGGAGAGLSKYGSGDARKIGGALTGVTNLASQFSPMGRVGASVGPAISGLAGGGSGGRAGPALSALTGLLGAAGGGAGGGALSGLLGGAGGSALSGLLGAAGGGGAASGISALTSLFGGSSAVGQLSSFLQRPETQQAFAALNLQQLGRRTVPVGSNGAQLPTSVFPQVLSRLADQVANEAAEWSGDGEAELAYMMDAEGAYVGDPALDRDRAARAWMLLNEAQAERVLEAISQPATRSSARPPPMETWDADTEYYDQMDSMEAFNLGPYGGEGEYADY